MPADFHSRPFRPVDARRVGRGFTLIALLLPALGAARKAAQLSACTSNLRQCATGAFIYSTDNKGMLPPAIWPNTTRFGATGANFQNQARWSRDYVAPIVLDEEFALNAAGYTEWLEATKRSVFSRPRAGKRFIAADNNTVDNLTNPWLWGYAFNGLVTMKESDYLAGGMVSAFRGRFKKIEAIRSTAGTMLLMESYSMNEDADRMQAGNTQLPFTEAAAQHLERGTIGYADGHAANIAYANLPLVPTQTPDWQTFWLGY